MRKLVVLVAVAVLVVLTGAAEAQQFNVSMKHWTNESVARLSEIVAEIGEVCEVQPGDNLTKIARELQLTVPELLLMNPQITDPDHILPGQLIYYLPKRTNLFNLPQKQMIRRIR